MVFIHPNYGYLYLLLAISEISGCPQFFLLFLRDLLSTYHFSMSFCQGTSVIVGTQILSSFI
jgi:hypothetical protein